MNVILDEIGEELALYYQERAAGDGAAYQVGWRDHAAQQRRFEALFGLVNPTLSFSINDLGCGLGCLFDFISRQTPVHFSYKGYDVLADMISRAELAHTDCSGASFCLISNADEMDVADYSVASGIFNMRGRITEDRWLYYVLSTLSVLHTKSRSGFGFNVLTRYSDADRMRSELYYADPCFFFDYCKRNFSRNVALLHDYEEYDFTILVRKE